MRSSGLVATGTRFFGPLLTLVLIGCAKAPEMENMTDAAKKARIEAMYEEYRAEFPGVREIDAAGLMALEKAGSVVVVDVREPEERSISIIPGSIDKAEFERRLPELGDIPVVLHCTIGYRSGVYAGELRGRGIEAMNLKGSILAWAHAGGPVVDREGKATRRVHVYGKQWALLPEGWEAVYDR